MIISAIFLLFLISLQSMDAAVTSSTSSTSRTSTTTTTSKPSTTSRPKSTSITKSTSSRPTSSTSTQVTTTPVPHWSDPSVGGKYGNPGAALYLSNKSIDQIHLFASNSLARAIQNLTIADMNVAIGSATLLVKPPRITESKFANFDYDLIPSNRIRSKFYNGKIVADGEWQYKSPDTQKALFLGRAMSGVYRATINNGELETTNQLARTSDAKPMVQTIDCRGNFSRFQVDIEGVGHTTFVENCDDPICRKIRTFFEDVACQVLRTFMKESINKKLATFPTLIETYSRNHKINYALQMNEPKVSEFDIRAGLEGKSLWYNNGNVPFNPVQLDFVNRNQMATFVLSDYSFNTLFHQSHSQRFQYSAAELLQNSPSIQDQLSLNCTKPSKGDVRKYRGPSKGGAKCMGTIFQRWGVFFGGRTNPRAQFASNATGDLVYKSNQRAPSIIVHSKTGSFFDASNGYLEVYGPVGGQDQKQQLLGRADVRVLRGDFIPKFNGANITGSIKITNLTLVQPSMQGNSLSDQSVTELTQFAQPLLTEMFNMFLQRYAQFTIPVPDGVQCASPDFLINSRSMQVDCGDMRCWSPYGWW